MKSVMLWWIETLYHTCRSQSSIHIVWQLKDSTRTNQRATIISALLLQVECIKGGDFSYWHQCLEFHESQKRTGTDFLLQHKRNNPSLLRMTVLLCNRNVCICLPSICGDICFISSLLSVWASTHFKCCFYVSTQCVWGRQPISVCEVCLAVWKGIKFKKRKLII